MRATGYGVISHLAAKCGTVTVHSWDFSKVNSEVVYFTDRTVGNLDYPDDLTDVLSLGDLVTFSAEWEKREQRAICDTIEVYKPSGQQPTAVIATVQYVSNNVGNLVVTWRGVTHSVRFGKQALVTPPGTPFFAKMPEIVPPGTRVKAKLVTTRANAHIVVSVSRDVRGVSATTAADPVRAGGRAVQDAQTETKSGGVSLEREAVAAVKWTVSQESVSSAAMMELYKQCPKLVMMCFDEEHG